MSCYRRHSITITAFLFMLAHTAYAEDNTHTVNCQASDQGQICTPAYNPLNLSFVVMYRTLESGAAIPGKIIVQKEGKAFQELSLAEEVQEGGRGDSIAMLDINFDGYDDLQLLAYGGGTPNASYVYWLYDTASGQFIRRGDMDVLSGADISPNPDNKTIDVAARDSCCAWSRITYRWLGNTLQMQSSSYEGLYTLCGIPVNHDDKNGDCLNDYICGITTDNYDDRQLLADTRIDIPADSCKQDTSIPTLSLAELENRLKQNAKGYRVRREYGSDTEGGILITYDPPLANSMH